MIKFLSFCLLLSVLTSVVIAEEYSAVVTAGVLNLRKEASTGAEIITRLKRHAKVTVLEEKDDWVRLRDADGKTGFAAKRYIKRATGAEGKLPTNDPAEKKKDTESPKKTSEKPEPKSPEGGKSAADSVPPAKTATEEKAFLDKFQLEAKSGRDVTVRGVFFDAGKGNSPRYALLKVVGNKYVVDDYLELPRRIKTANLNEKEVKVTGTQYKIPGWKNNIIWGRKIVVLEP